MFYLFNYYNKNKRESRSVSSSINISSLNDVDFFYIDDNYNEDPEKIFENMRLVLEKKSITLSELCSKTFHAKGSDGNRYHLAIKKEKKYYKSCINPKEYLDSLNLFFNFEYICYNEEGNIPDEFHKLYSSFSDGYVNVAESSTAQRRFTNNPDLIYEVFELSNFGYYISGILESLICEIPTKPISPPSKKVKGKGKEFEFIMWWGQYHNRRQLGKYLQETCSFSI